MNGESVWTGPGNQYKTDIYHFTAGKNCKILGGNSSYFDWESRPNIYITQDVAVTGVTLDKTEAALNIGETVTLAATVAPDDATDKTVTWTSSDETVATVTDGVVTALAAGTATITVTTTDGAKTATCTVTVAEPTYSVTVKEGTEDAANWTITPTSAKAGETVTITYTGTKKVKSIKAVKKASATVLSGALVDGATIKVNFKWRMQDSGDYVQGVYNASSGTFTVSKGGNYWGSDERALYKVEKSGDNIIIGAGFYGYDMEGMVWTFNTTNDTYTYTQGSLVSSNPDWYGLTSVTLNGTNITSQLTQQ